MLEASDIVLVVVCLSVSLFSASIGTSAGVNFAAMATVLPPAVVVPIHGLVEGLSSAIRWILFREYVNYRFLVAFTLGGSIGLLAGWPFIGAFSDEGLKTLLGAFFLFTTWAPLGWMRLPPLLGGASTSSLSVLVGATGPLVAALIARQEPDHRVVIGTQGACTTFQHWGKVLLFSVWGFSFANYAGLIVALTLTTVIGTWLGKRILLRVPQRVLRLTLKLIVTVLGLRLLLQGLEIRLSDVPIGSWTGGALVLVGFVTACHLGYDVAVRKNRASEAETKRKKSRPWMRDITIVTLTCAASVVALSSPRVIPVNPTFNVHAKRTNPASLRQACDATGVPDSTSPNSIVHSAAQAAEPTGGTPDRLAQLVLRYSQTLGEAARERGAQSRTQSQF